MDYRTTLAAITVTVTLFPAVILRVWSQRLGAISSSRLAIARHEGMIAWSLRLRSARPRYLAIPGGIIAWSLRLRSCSPPDRLTLPQHEALLTLLDAFDEEEMALEFWQIENAVGALPHGATRSVCWWTGAGAARPAWHPPGIWQDAGYIAYPPNLRRRFVTFRRRNHPRQRQETMPDGPTGTD